MLDGKMEASNDISTTLEVELVTQVVADEMTSTQEECEEVPQFYEQILEG